jgi:hypothetical protein
MLLGGASPTGPALFKSKTKNNKTERCLYLHAQFLPQPIARPWATRRGDFFESYSAEPKRTQNQPTRCAGKKLYDIDMEKTSFEASREIPPLDIV